MFVQILPTGFMLRPLTSIRPIGRTLCSEFRGGSRILESRADGGHNFNGGHISHVLIITVHPTSN